MALSDTEYLELLDTRVTDPGAIDRAWAARTRPAGRVRDDGRVFLVAADHAARGALAVGDRPLAMADRRGMLERLCVALDHPGVDGVLASADVLEDLLLLGRLEAKLVIGTMNRGGLAGACWGLDDPMTAYSAQGLVERGLDGGKMLLRIDDDDPGTLPTLVACAAAITELNAAGLMAMVEPLAYSGGALNKDLAAQIRAICVAEGLADTTAHTWMKLPAPDEVEAMMTATTLPTLILGGAPDPDPERAFDAWERALAVPNVRGLVIGRSLLYPADEDVAGAIDRAAAIVHTESPT